MNEANKGAAAPVQTQGNANVINNSMGAAPQQQQQHQYGQTAAAGGQAGHGGHGAMPGYPAYYCAPTPAQAPAYWEQTSAPAYAGAMPPPPYAQAPAYPPPPHYAPQAAPQMGGYPHPGYMPMPQAAGYAPMPHPAYGYAQPPYPAQAQTSDNGLSSFFNFRDERFTKGAITGAALTFILTNESLQKNTLKSVIKFWNMLQGGVEEMKERIQDIDAEIKAEHQK